jgi:SAM-dependent methyltransferase
MSSTADATISPPYTEPREVTDPEECFFYHALDLPGYGTVQGDWDLRANVDRYLGGVDFNGKRVLDVGTATGFLAFHMERQGAEVIAHDLPEDGMYDLVPYARWDYPSHVEGARDHIRRSANGFWLAHGALGSQVRLVGSSIYDIPDSIGPVDAVTIGCVLLHLRDPFRALQQSLKLVRETAVVVETAPHPFRAPWSLLPRARVPSAGFLPDYRKPLGGVTWWRLPPSALVAFLGVLGFEDTTVRYHVQRFTGRRRLLYTIVARRTGPTFV